MSRNSITVALLAGLVLTAGPSWALANEPPSAEQLYHRFEARLAGAPAVSVAYEGELVFRNGDINKTLPYAGAWATSPECKASTLVDWDMHLVSGIKVTPSEDPDAEPGFFDLPPNNLFIGPIARSGFFGDVLYQFLREERSRDEEDRDGPIAALGLTGEQVVAARQHAGGYYFTLNPVDDYAFEPADADDPGIRVLRCSLQQMNGASCPIRLWLESETLRPLRREIVIRTGEATFTFSERYRAFSTDAIPETFEEHQRATRSLPVIVEQGRLAEQVAGDWIETEWLLEGARLRTLEPTRLRFLGEEATVTLTAGSEFVMHEVERHNFGLPDSSDALIPDGASADPEQDASDPAPGAVRPREGFDLLSGHAAFEIPDRSRFTLLLGGHAFREPYESDEPFSVWTASPTRFIVEEGGADDLQVGVEYDLETGVPEPQPARTLPNLSIDVTE